MIAYASRTGTGRNLDALRVAGWRLFAAPNQLHRYASVQPVWRDGSPARYALDNGAWSAHTAGGAFDEELFLGAFGALGAGADFVVLPDIVAGGLKSLAYSLSWLPRLEHPHFLLAVQDGMTPEDVRPHLGQRVGVAVGGTTDWKLGTLHHWGSLARETGCWLHVLRVNSQRRIRRCQDVGAHSFDGSGPSRFAKHLAVLDAAVRQRHLWEN